MILRRIAHSFVRQDWTAIGIVRGSTSYSAYLRTAREWSAIHLATADQQKDRALKLLADIDAYLGRSQRVGREAARR